MRGGVGCGGRVKRTSESSPGLRTKIYARCCWPLSKATYKLRTNDKHVYFYCSRQRGKRPSVKLRQNMVSTCSLGAARGSLVLLLELGDGSDETAEGHAERGEHEGADARGARLDVVDLRDDRLLRDRDREQRVAGEALVDDHAENAHHRRAAVVALRVQLELLATHARLVVVANPEITGDVAWRFGRVLREHRVVQKRHDEDNLGPSEIRQRRPRRNRASRHVRELDVFSDREVPRPAETRLRDEDVQASGHRE